MILSKTLTINISTIFASNSVELSSQIFGTTFFAIASYIALAIAKRKGFFDFSFKQREANITHKIIFISFFLYLLINSIASPLVLKLFHPLFVKYTNTNDLHILQLSIINLIGSSLVALSLAFLSFFLIKNQISFIWKERSDLPGSYLTDIKIALVTWVISFPVVMLSSNFFELVLKYFFCIKDIPNQVAIDYVKMAKGNSGYIVMATISMILFAPLIEEFLFRGLLQNYIRKYLGIKTGIILTSFIFAMLHFSFPQGVSNITIIPSLFILSLFLGYIYERQRSLISPIILHATFNAISVLNLLLLKDV